jgi:hypothetical protein
MIPAAVPGIRRWEPIAIIVAVTIAVVDARPTIMFCFFFSFI